MIRESISLTSNISIFCSILFTTFCWINYSGPVAFGELTLVFFVLYVIVFFNIFLSVFVLQLGITVFKKFLE